MHGSTKYLRLDWKILSSLSLQVRSIVKSYRWAPFVPVGVDSSMLTVLLLLSKYRLRNVPVVEAGKPSLKNYITQSAVIHGLKGCKGRDWFDSIAGNSISELGLPFMQPNEVRSIFYCTDNCSS